MGECLISGRTGESVVRSKWKYVTELITQNIIWEVPDNIDLSKGISVRIFGGGGGSTSITGGGGGYMNNTIFNNLEIGQKIQINIANGGVGANSGATTFFGNYLSANGGTSNSSVVGLRNALTLIGGSGSSGGGCLDHWSTWAPNGARGGKGYQFGGGGGVDGGGDGGYWGGGGGTGIYSGGTTTPVTFSNTKAIYSIAGNGGYYGGGGGFCSGSYTDGNYNKNYSEPTPNRLGGFGGYYGGGGGGFWYYPIDINNYGLDDVAFFKGGCIRQNEYNSESGIIGYSNLAGDGSICLGSTRSGAGSILGTVYDAKNGTDTSAWTNVFNDGNEYFRGNGKRGSNGGGGGGFGGNGGNGIICNNAYIWYNANIITDRPYIYGGGGGGYSGNGGDAAVKLFQVVNSNDSNDITDYRFGGAGGGGGFGGDGGNGGFINIKVSSSSSSPWQCGGGGGGGGYGKSAKGGDASGGGGGYYGAGGNNCGGGGAYGNGGDGGAYGHSGNDGMYGGGGGRNGGNGGNGICIIQYYAKSLVY